MELEKIIEEQFKEIIESGFIKKTIQEQLKKTIESIIGDCLRAYSDFGKEVEKQVKKALSLGNMELNLPAYNQLILTWITEIINNTIISTGKEQIEKNLKKFFKPLEKSEYKISEIIDIFKKDFGEDGESGDITFIRDKSSSSDGYVSFYFDAEYDKDKYLCDYSLRINKEGLWDITLKGEEGKKIKNATFYGFDSFLFQLYAARVKIIDDYEDVNTSYGDYDD